VTLQHATAHFPWGKVGGGVKLSVQLIPGLRVAPSLCLRGGIIEILSGVHHTREIEKGCLVVLVHAAWKSAFAL